MTAQLTSTTRHATIRDRAAVANALSLAFYDDPVVSWLVPDDRRRRAALPPIFELFADAFLPHGEVRVTDDGAGAALWVPPGVEPVAPEDADAFGERVAEITGEDAPRTFALMEIMEENHPHEPAYYLQLVGVVPERQGHGIGAALMAPVLDQCDREGAPAYLEATSLGSRQLYERLGFEVIGEFAPAGCPPLWPMWRT
jgi:GNAT superfamily N-acetyltransferase